MKTLIIIIGVILVIMLMIVFLVSNFIIKMVFDRDNQWYDRMGHKLMNPDNFNQTKTVYDEIEDKQISVGETFWQSSQAKDYWLTVDTHNLFSRIWTQETETHDWVICVHGYRSTGKRDMAYAGSKLYEKGFNVVIPDLRAHGKSEGKTIGMGWSDRLDILAFVKEVCLMDKQARIILYGGSMGAATVMMASGEELPANVKGIIADCGYSSVYAEFKSMLGGFLKGFALPFLEVSNILAKKKMGYSLKEASTVAQLQRNHLPLLLVHGTKDKFVPHEMMYENMEASQGDKEGLLIENAPHLSSSIYEPEHYFTTLFNFINDYCQENVKEGA